MTKGTRNKAQGTNLKVQLAEATADLQRVQADFVNYKRRAEEIMDERLKLGQQMAMTALLSTLDNLERAMTHLPKELVGNPWAEGVKKSAEQMLQELSKLGLSKIDVLAQHFDPEFMDAVSVEGEGNDEFVAEVIQAGYRFNDEVIRHAVVKVERR